MQSTGRANLLEWSLSPEFLHRYREGVTFRKSWTVRFFGNEVIFFGNRTLSIPNLGQPQIGVIEMMVHGAKLEDLLTILPPAELSEILVYMERNELIRPAYANQFIGTRFEKQVEFFADFVDDPNQPQQRLLKASVCILGCGGTGNILVQHLVSCGVKKFTLIDGDRVENSNFNRQFCFDTKSLGQPKVEALRQYILDREPAAEVRVCHQLIGSTQELIEINASSRPDIIVCCADTPPIAIHTYVLECCFALGIPCIFGAVGIHDGHFGPLLTEAKQIEKMLEHKRQQLELIERMRSVEEGTGVIPGSISYLNTTVAATIAGEAIDFLSGIKRPVSLGSSWQYNPYTKSSIKVQDY